jgi:hypothetical protein
MNDNALGWQIQARTFDGLSPKLIAEELEKMGRDGWELVSISKIEFGAWVAWLRRLPDPDG